MRPLISFVIPVSSHVVGLERCLTSIVRNDYPRELIQIIVVANDGADAAARATRQLGSVVLQSSERSIAALRNKGARAALGRILAFVAPDREIDRRWIANAVEALSDPGVAASGMWQSNGNFAVTRSAFERVGGFDVSLATREDVDVCRRLQTAGV